MEIFKAVPPGRIVKTASTAASFVIRTPQAMRLAMNLLRGVGADREKGMIDADPNKLTLSLKGISLARFEEYYRLFMEEIGEDNISGSFHAG